MTRKGFIRLFENFGKALVVMTALFVVSLCLNGCTDPGEDVLTLEELQIAAGTEDVAKEDVLSVSASLPIAAAEENAGAVAAPEDYEGKIDSETDYAMYGGIPVVYITTEAEVKDKEDYVDGTITIFGQEYSMGIRGRGNSGWTYPKKAYRIKLDEKASIFGMKPDRDYALVSMFCDKSLMRDMIAHDMACCMDGLEYTPERVLIELYFNEEYMGVYQLTEKIEEGKSKVNIASDGTEATDATRGIGFMLEYGWDFDGRNIKGQDYFDTEYSLRVYVKEPEITERWNDDMNYIHDYLSTVEQCVVNHENYEDYIDMDSWVDWFIVTELANNTETSFFRSCYMYKKEDGKLYLGPIWDYDMAFGNFTGDDWNYDSWASGESNYQYTNCYNMAIYLVRDEKFMMAVRDRWNEKKEELLETALRSVEDYATTLGEAQERNFERWDILYTCVGLERATGMDWEDQVEYLKEFLEKRYVWIDEELNDGTPYVESPVTMTPAIRRQQEEEEARLLEEEAAAAENEDSTDAGDTP